MAERELASFFSTEQRAGTLRQERRRSRAGLRHFTAGYCLREENRRTWEPTLDAASSAHRAAPHSRRSFYP